MKFFYLIVSVGVFIAAGIQWNHYLQFVHAASKNSAFYSTMQTTNLAVTKIADNPRAIENQHAAASFMAYKAIGLTAIGLIILVLIWQNRTDMKK